MNPAFAALLLGLFVGWWAGVVTALGISAQMHAYLEDEAQFDVDGGLAVGSLPA